MKKIHKVALLLFMLPILAYADIVEIDGINYFLFSGSKTASVNRKDGGYSGDVVVPATVVYNNVTYEVNEVLSYAFSGNDNLKSVSLPEGIVKISDCVFFAAHGLETVSMPSTITKWGNAVFAGCTSLKTFFLPDWLTEIPRNTFDGCESLTDIVISEKITAIGEKAFASCEKVKTIKIPASVKEIGDMAFWCCNPEEIYCYAEIVPQTEIGAFDVLDIEATTLYVPAAALDEYKNAEAWKDFVKIVAIE